MCRLGQYLFRRYTSYFFSWGTKIIFCSYNLHCGENIDLNVSYRVLWVLILISLQTHPPPPHATIFICYYHSIEFLRENNPAITCCGCSIIASMVLECLTQRAGTKTTLSQVISAADICHQKDINTVIWENVLLKKKSNSKAVKWDWPEPHSLHTHRQRGITAQEDMEAAFVRRWNERGLWEGSRSEQSGVKLEISRLRCESERTSFDSWAGDSQSATLCARCRNGKGAIEL